ncbi:MAG: hypothetical protein IPJ25_10220 [Rhodocyclaceae bacterium]|nr:hypothetical protein [Rhodocyclaceae bacterium]
MSTSGPIFLSLVVASACGFASLPASAVSPMQPALLATTDAVCRAEISSAASRLTGRSISLAADAFIRNDSVPLTSVGEAADGRMLRPAQVLQLGIDADGCKLGLAGRENWTAVKSCGCQTAATLLFKPRNLN